jgi:gluconate 5-dehydrogenase
MTVFDRFRLDGRRAMITGGSRGLGRAMAQAFAEAGADLILVGRETETLKKAATELGALGRKIDTIIGDVGVPSEAERVCKLAVEKGAIDILVNNVGGRRISIPTEDLPLKDWQHILDLNLTSAFLCCQEIGRGMIERKRGSIINVASISGIVVNKGIHGRTYETSKAAMTAFTKTLAVDWAQHNIRVNAIAPGGFLTDPNRRWFREKPELHDIFVSQIPMGRLGEPDEIGPLAVYLASDASSYMTGATVVIDGGYTLW